MTDDPASQSAPDSKRRRTVDNTSATTPGRIRNKVEDGLAHVIARAKQAGHIRDLTGDSGWWLLSPWIPGTDTPLLVPELESLLRQQMLGGKDTWSPLSHGIKLLGIFSDAVCEINEIVEDDDIESDLIDTAMVGWLQWLMNKCDDGNEEDEDLVGGFYYDNASNMGWLSDREGPHFLLIDFNKRCVLMTDKSLCRLHESRSGAGNVDNVIKSPLEGYADFRVRNQPTSFVQWWEDYV
jgi:hypothetical protein